MAELPSPSLGSTLQAAGRRLRKAPWPWMWAVVVYAALAVIILRGDFGTAGGAYPKGTNAGNAYAIYAFQQHFGLTNWLSPYTDWGQPFPGYPGVDPQNLIALSGVVNPTEYVRSVEGASMAVSGLAMCWSVRRFGGTAASALSAGVFYELMTEVPHFFEGHLSIMISLSLAPFILVLSLDFFMRPTLTPGLFLAGLIYLAASLGDLGALYRILFFVAFLALGTIIYRLVVDRYSRSELIAIALGGGTLVASLLPWIITYLGGVRPQFTTGITNSIAPFPATGGESIYSLFIGFAGDNSYSFFFLNSYTYAWDYSSTQILFAVIPILAGIYAIGWGRARDRLLYLSGLTALIISTGPLYPGLSLFNQGLYRFVPDFDTDPLLFHWEVYYILVVGLMFGLCLTRIELGLRAWARQSPLSNLSIGTAEFRRGPVEWLRRPGRGPGALVANGLSPILAASFVALLLFSAASPMIQNWEAFTEPPTTFEYPTNYTVGYRYVASQPDLGSLLAVPFGNIYERTPWGGVSVSSELAAGIGSGRNLLIFEAGTPQSLAMDRIVGGALAEFDSNNLTKLLGGMGVEYVVSTTYPNWNYANDPFYDPITSVEGLTKQIGLGSTVFASGYQQVFRIAGAAANVSAFHEYVVYDGPSSLVYEIMNQPWYSGQVGLVSLSDVPSSETAIVLDHAAAFVADPVKLGNLTAVQWTDLGAAAIPFVVLLGAGAFSGSSALQFSVPWNASNGVAAGTVSPTVPMVDSDFLPLLQGRAYGSATVLVRASGPSGSVVTVGDDAGHSVNLSLGASSGFRLSSSAVLDLQSATQLQVTADPVVQVDTVSLSFRGALAPSSPRQDDYAAQGVLTDESFRLTGSGWSLVQLPQVYSALWHLDGPVASSYHLVTNVGLNGWLVNTSGPVALTILYEGVPLLHAADIAEGSLLLVIALSIVYLIRRRSHRTARAR